ncbi:hypothetical protein HYH02_003561 [Chlamydomonas schloesseri]|uniref:Uncharacterized protein n=1 Tax=Chlamydomonas schloesseri TaxID=2026947 RepID=A0A835WPQ1_9CHLO|nr:hypothetical protein HYH02_003561 [Chlamydomonas schloesseri]|eukprot:KAG2451783.1 hypothetical protein HYH02_003561 [Chlamydomonas schloesseri]
MFNSGGPPRLGAAPALGAGATGPSGGNNNYLQLLENYGRLIAGQEGQLATLREQRAGLAGELEAARRQRDAATELASTARARTAALEAERRTKECDLHAIKARNDALRADIEARRSQLEGLKQQQGESKELFVTRCMQLEQEVRAVLAEHTAAAAAAAATTAAAAAAAGAPGGGAVYDGGDDGRNQVDQLGPVAAAAAAAEAASSSPQLGAACGMLSGREGNGGSGPSLQLVPGLTVAAPALAPQALAAGPGGSGPQLQQHSGGGGGGATPASGEGLPSASQEGVGEGAFGSQLPCGPHTQ